MFFLRGASDTPLLIGLTLFQVGLKIYVSWWGGAFKAPPMFSLKMTYLGPKNNKTIIPHIFEDLMEGLEPKHPPMVPQKTYFFVTRQKILKIGCFQKSRFLGGQRGVFGFLNIQNGFIYQYLLFWGAWRPKNAIFQKF